MFQKQTKTNKDQGDKQIEAVEKQGKKQLAVPSDIDLYANKKDNLLFFKQKEIFNYHYGKRFDRMDRLTHKMYFNELYYVYKICGYIIKLDDFIRLIDFCDKIKKSEIMLE